MCCTLPPTKKLETSLLSVAQFQALAAEEQEGNPCYIVYDGFVCNMTGFEHPGGPFLEKFNGTDATEYINLSHETDKHVQALIRLKRIGRLEDPDALLAAEDKELRQLRRKYIKEGLFHRSGFLSLTELVVLAITACLCYSLGCFSAGTVVSYLFVLRTMWWGHDVAHHCTFSDGVLGGKVFEWVAFFVIGVFPRTEFRSHAVHHVFPNVLEMDWVGLGPFQIDEMHSHRSPKWFIKIQAALWFLLAMPLSGLILGLNIAITQCTKWQRGLMAVRMIIAWYYLDTISFLVPFVAIATFLYITCLNHFHMAKVWDNDQRPKSFVRAMVEPTCNIEGGPIWTWLSGGLDLHIEHHVFPTMAHGKFRHCQADVKALLRRHGIPYHSIPLHKAIWYNFLHLIDPYGPTMGSLSPVASVETLPFKNKHD